MGPGCGCGRPETGLYTDAHPLPGFMHGPGVGSVSRECPACGVDPGAADVHARGRAGGSQGPLAGWWLLVEGSWLVYAAGASPFHPP